jgi:hypothetical protein
MAPIIERLELDGDVVVSAARLGEVVRDVGGNEDPRRLAYELQRAGWLGSLRTRGAWEFLPAARGGAYGSGDRLIEFRAQLAVNPTWPGVLAMESAASVLGFAQRLPEREVVALPPDVPPPKAFAGEWRVVTVVLPAQGTAMIDRLPTWNLEGLLAGIAIRPSGYRDIPGLGQWLPERAASVNIDVLVGLIAPFTSSAQQRAAYLLAAGGNSEASTLIVRRFPPRGVARFGPRRPGGVFDAATQVNDTVLFPYLTVGTGA